MLPEELGNSSIKRIVAFYRKIFYDRYGFSPTISYPMIGKLFKPTLEQFSELQVAAFILLHFSWKGMEGTDDFVHRRLSDSCFPLEWIPRNVNAYQAYYRNVIGIDFDSEIAIKELLEHSNKV